MQFCGGFVRGVSIKEEPPTYVQEAGALHALRAYKEWMSRQDQSRFKWAEMKAGNALASLRLRDWMRVGRCTLESPAASGLIAELQGMAEWLEVDTFFRPFYQPETLAEGDGEEVKDPLAELFVRMAEHFRSVVIMQQGGK